MRVRETPGWPADFNFLNTLRCIAAHKRTYTHTKSLMLYKDLKYSAQRRRLTFDPDFRYCGKSLNHQTGACETVRSPHPPTPPRNTHAACCEKLSNTYGVITSVVLCCLFFCLLFVCVHHNRTESRQYRLSFC